MKKCFLTFLTILLCIHIQGQSYPGADVIGMGYDIFGEYANNKSLSHYPLFDFSRMKKRTNGFSHNLPRLVTVNNISDHIIRAVEGENRKEYISNMSSDLELGFNAFYFQASIEKQVKNSSSESENMFFYTYMDINTKWRVNLDTRNMDTLRHYLDKQFSWDLAQLPPDQLFERYGTHFVASSYLGGRIDYSVSGATNERITKEAIKIAAKAKIKQIEGGAELNEDVQETYRNISQSEHLNVIGGNSEFVVNISNHDSYVKWAEGINTKPVLSGFDERSLKPIWILEKDAGRRKELEDYFVSSVLPNHPIPETFSSDDVLDNQDVTQKFTIYFDKFFIEKDCDYQIIGGDQAGDFKYHIKLIVNGELINSASAPEPGKIYKRWHNEEIVLNYAWDFSVPIQETSEIEVWVKLVEEDDFDVDVLGPKSIKHRFPFFINDLYNIEKESHYYWHELLQDGSDCRAYFYYSIFKQEIETATDFGNKGWQEYLDRDYDKSLYYSKEALKLDNSLWFVQYNVAFIYLIQKNPKAFEKYKLVTKLYPDTEHVNAALQDILNHEEKFGVIPNSEPVKLWLRSKL